MTQWQYLTKTLDSSGMYLVSCTPSEDLEQPKFEWASINELGAAGWELVSVFTISDRAYAYGVFKRPDELVGNDA